MGQSSDTRDLALARGPMAGRSAPRHSIRKTGLCRDGTDGRLGVPHERVAWGVGRSVFLRADRPFYQFSHAAANGKELPPISDSALVLHLFRRIRLIPFGGVLFSEGDPRLVFRRVLALEPEQRIDLVTAFFMIIFISASVM